MNKKVLLAATAVVAVIGISISVVLLTMASPEQKIYRVGILVGSNIFATVTDGFKEKMAEFGYVEGKNITYDVQTHVGDIAGYDAAAKKFVTDKDDLILSFPTEPTVEVKKMTQGTSIPTVFLGDIEGNDLVHSIQAPGGAITGVRIGGIDATLKNFEFLKEIVPRATRIYLLYDANYPLTAPALPQSRLIAAKLGQTLVELPAVKAEDITSDLAKRDARSDIGVDAIVLFPGPIVTTAPAWAAIAAFGEKHKIPIAGRGGDAITTGALFVYIPDNKEMGALAAEQADKIFRGIPPGTLPVLSAVLRLIVNVKQAAAIDLTVPPDFLRKADEIIH